MGSLVTPGIESLRPYEAGKPEEELARELGITDAIKVASNENPLGASPRAMEALRGALGRVHRYPDAAAWALRDRLAREHGVSLEEVVQGNGSNELIELLIRTFTTGEDHVVFGEPAFVVYRLACVAHGVPFTAVPLADFVHDLPAMARAVTPRTRLVFVANPNNPTGTHVGRPALERFLAEVPPEVLVVLDEAYVQYVDAPDWVDGLALRGLRERLVVLRTFSKIYGLAALRVGYAVAPAEIAGYLHRVRAPFNVGTLGQVAAVAALDDHEHVDRSRRINAEGRRSLIGGLRELGLAPAPSQANFVWVDVGRSGREVYQAMLRRGVIVRPFGEGPFLRITVGSAEETARTLRALREVLA